jgi:hypothetical protein
MNSKKTEVEPHCSGHEHFEYDCIDCSDALERMRRGASPGDGTYTIPADVASECGECGLTPDGGYVCDHETCPVGRFHADGCCDICREPLADECACQNEYAREHDNYAER